MIGYEDSMSKIAVIRRANRLRLMISNSEGKANRWDRQSAVCMRVHRLSLSGKGNHRLHNKKGVSPGEQVHR